MLCRLEEAGLCIKKSKCCMMASSVEYLGHRIDQYGLHPIEGKIQAIQAAPEPKNLSELKSYLVLLNYYGKFLPRLSTVLAPLYNLLRAAIKWRWSKQEREAF